MRWILYISLLLSAASCSDSDSEGRFRVAECEFTDWQMDSIAGEKVLVKRFPVMIHAADTTVVHLERFASVTFPARAFEMAGQADSIAVEIEKFEVMGDTVGVFTGALNGMAVRGYVDGEQVPMQNGKFAFVESDRSDRPIHPKVHRLNKDAWKPNCSPFPWPFWYPMRHFYFKSNHERKDSTNGPGDQLFTHNYEGTWVGTREFVERYAAYGYWEQQAPLYTKLTNWPLWKVDSLAADFFRKRLSAIEYESDFQRAWEADHLRNLENMTAMRLTGVYHPDSIRNNPGTVPEGIDREELIAVLELAQKGILQRKEGGYLPSGRGIVSFVLPDTGTFGIMSRVYDANSVR